MIEETLLTLWESLGMKTNRDNPELIGQDGPCCYHKNPGEFSIIIMRYIPPTNTLLIRNYATGSMWNESSWKEHKDLLNQTRTLVLLHGGTVLGAPKE